VSEDQFEAFDWRRTDENVSELISERWMLITPGAPGRWNTMTASWGGFGHLWDGDAAFVFVRPSRYTYGFMEAEEGFTLSFFDEGRRGALDLCGSTSGRDTDKAKAAGITPRSFRAQGKASAPGEGKLEPPRTERVGFEEARLVVSCRKAYSQDLDATRFIDPGIGRHYLRGDLHRLYIGYIEGAWKKR
jgi:flavin reductase (DIM6/NTAB) family NADH-FMN oxidoreductase RutF